MKTFIEWYYKFLKVALTVLMGLLILPVTLQIITRSSEAIPNSNFIWTEEIARFCFVWVIMVGSMIAVKESTHFDVDLLPHPKTPRAKGIADLIVHLGMMIMAVAFTYYGYDFAKFGYIQHSAQLGINLLWVYIAFPLSGVTWILFLMEKLAVDFQLIFEPKAEEPA